MSWHRGPMTAFDTETTGVDVESVRIVTATVVEIVPGRAIESHNWLIDPGVEIPAEAAAVHGITTERARTEGVEPGPAVAEIFARLDDAWGRGVPVVAYNACFDLTILDRELRRHGHQPIKAVGPVVDPLVIDKAVDRYRKGKRTLTAACDHYEVELGEAHTSAADALAAARVAWRMAETIPELRELDLESLHARQAGWYANQQRSFAEYLHRLAARETDEAKKADLLARVAEITSNVAWPMRPHAGQAVDVVA